MLIIYSLCSYSSLLILLFYSSSISHNECIRDLELQPDSSCFNDFLRQSSVSAMLTVLDLPTLKSSQEQPEPKLYV